MEPGEIKTDIMDRYSKEMQKREGIITNPSLMFPSLALFSQLLFLSVFLGPLGEADWVINQVLIRGPKWASVERLAAASMCGAGLIPPWKGSCVGYGSEEAHRMAAHQLLELRIITWPALKVGFTIIRPPRN